jgi:hypothetical protein
MAATTESLANNIDRGYKEGLIRNPAIYTRMRSLVGLARFMHQTNNHAVEYYYLSSLIVNTPSVRVQIDPTFAARVRSLAREVIDTRR